MQEPYVFSDFFVDKVALPSLFGAIAFLLCYLAVRLVKAPGLRRQFDDVNERLIEATQRLVRAKNDVVLIEIEIAELVEKVEPETRRRWVRELTAVAHALPVMVMQQLKRFGLIEPPPEEPPAPQPWSPPSAPPPSHVIHHQMLAEQLPPEVWVDGRLVPRALAG